MANDKRMNPISGEEVETTGVYQNEWGGEETFKRGDTFTADAVLGETEWKLLSLPLESMEGELYKDTSEDTEVRQQHLPGRELGQQSPPRQH